MVGAPGAFAQQAAAAAGGFSGSVRAGASVRAGRLWVVMASPGQDVRERRRLISRCATKARTSTMNIAQATVAERPIW